MSKEQKYYLNWNPNQGDYEFQSADYVERHERVIRREKISNFLIKSFASLGALGATYAVLSLVANISI